MSKAARALAIGRKIGELEAEVRPLLDCIAELKKEHALLFSPFDDPNAEDEAEAAKKKPKRGRGRPPKVAKQEAPQEWKPLANRVLDFFAATDGQQANLDTIAEAIGDANRQSLRETMVNLCKGGKLARVQRGVYAPAKPKAMIVLLGRE
jgi:hypothetical protein